VFTACGVTQSSAPEDGRNCRPKRVELIEIINKTVTGVSSWLFILLYQRCTVTLTSYFSPPVDILNRY